MVTAKLGERTDTSDAEGTSGRNAFCQCGNITILTALEQFRGDILQSADYVFCVKAQWKTVI